MSQPQGRPREQAKRVVKAITPPALVSAARRVRDARATPAAPEWEYVAEGWDRPPRVRGWNEPSVVDAYRRKLPAFRAAVAGPQPLAVPTSPSIPIGTANVADQNQNLAFAYALLLASRSRERVSVLDWGGGVGYFALLCRTILPPEVDVDFHCRDVPLVCDAGRELLPEVTFWTDDACLEREYDLVVASSSLQYAEDWRALLGRLARAASGYLFLTRVPTVTDAESFVVLQRAHHYEFETEYLSWVFNRGQLLAAASESGLTLDREFLLGYSPVVVGAPERDETWGYLFRSAR